MKTDAQLQQDVIAELEWEPSVDATRVGVAVVSGTVTLDGHVNSHAEKWHAERAARRVSGVRALVIKMDVSLPRSSHRNDADIALAAENAMLWTTFLPRQAVKVVVEDGWITLSGELDWDYQRQAAFATVSQLMGVRGVNDHITIKPQASAGAVKPGIEAALRRRAGAEAPRIQVEVQGGDVTLSGTVHSWAEHDLALHTAWGTPGVTSVADRLTFGA